MTRRACAGSLAATWVSAGGLMSACRSRRTWTSSAPCGREAAVPDRSSLDRSVAWKPFGARGVDRFEPGGSDRLAGQHDHGARQVDSLVDRHPAEPHGRAGEGEEVGTQAGGDDRRHPAGDRQRILERDVFGSKGAGRGRVVRPCASHAGSSAGRNPSRDCRIHLREPALGRGPEARILEQTKAGARPRGLPDRFPPAGVAPGLEERRSRRSAAADELEIEENRRSCAAGAAASYRQIEARERIAHRGRAAVERERAPAAPDSVP